MDINFQDRIDEYLLHPDRLSEEEKSQFLSELDANPEKRAQFELTCNVRQAVTSRARKMSRMEEMRTMYGHVRSHVAMNCLNAAEDRQDAPRRKRWVWLSGIAAAVVLGFFVARLVPGSSSSDDGLRGDDQVFDGTPSEGHSSALPGDTLSADTIGFAPQLIVHLFNRFS